MPNANPCDSTISLQFFTFANTSASLKHMVLISIMIVIIKTFLSEQYKDTIRGKFFRTVFLNTYSHQNKITYPFGRSICLHTVITRSTKRNCRMYSILRPYLLYRQMLRPYYFKGTIFAQKFLCLIRKHSLKKVDYDTEYRY